MCCVDGAVKGSITTQDLATLTQLLTAKSGPLLLLPLLLVLGRVTVEPWADLTCVGVAHTLKEGLMGPGPIHFSRLVVVLVLLQLAVPAIIIINFVSIIIKLPAS